MVVQSKASKLYSRYNFDDLDSTETVGEILGQPSDPRWDNQPVDVTGIEMEAEEGVTTFPKMVFAAVFMVLVGFYLIPTGSKG